MKISSLVSLVLNFGGATFRWNVGGIEIIDKKEIAIVGFDELFKGRLDTRREMANKIVASCLQSGPSPAYGVWLQDDIVYIDKVLTFDCLSHGKLSDAVAFAALRKQEAIYITGTPGAPWFLFDPLRDPVARELPVEITWYGNHALIKVHPKSWQAIGYDDRNYTASVYVGTRCEIERVPSTDDGRAEWFRIGRWPVTLQYAAERLCSQSRRMAFCG